MTRTATYSCALLALILLLPRGDPEPVSIVICHPGSPGTTKQAEKTMSAFAGHLQEIADLPEGSVSCVFFPEAEPALEFIRKEKPKVGIFSLSFYLRYREDLHLSPVLQVVRQDKGTQTFHLLVKKDRYPDLESLEGKRLVSNHIFDPAFLDRVVLGGKREDFVQAEETRKPLRVIRKVARGEEDSILVDGKQWETLRKMAGLGDRLVEVHRSRELPTEPVVTIGAGSDRPEIARVTEAMKKMADTILGKQLCRDLQMNHFRDPDKKAFAEVEKLYQGKPK